MILPARGKREMSIKRGCFGCMARNRKPMADATVLCGLCDGFYCDACIGPHYDEHDAKPSRPPDPDLGEREATPCPSGCLKGMELQWVCERCGHHEAAPNGRATQRDNAEACVSLLNEMVALDLQATKELVNARVRCNAALAAHPTIEVGIYDGQTKVGILGVLQGLFRDRENPTFGPIVLVISDDPDDNMLSFRLATEDEIERCLRVLKQEADDA